MALFHECVSFIFQFAGVSPAKEQWNAAKHSETAIDQTPSKRDSADRAGEERKRNHSGAGDEAKSDNPLVPDRINLGSDEGHRDDEMGKCEPVCPVSDKWAPGIRLAHTALNLINPPKQSS